MRRFLLVGLIAVLLLGVASRAFAAITLDTFSSQQVTSTNSITLSYTAASGARLFVQVIATGTAGIPNVTDVTYNGNSISSDRETTDGVQFHAMTFYDNGPSGSGDGAPHNIVVQFDQTISAAWLVVSSWNGVASFRDLGPGQPGNSSGTSNAPSTSITGLSGELLIDATAIFSAQTPTQDAAQTLITANNANGIGFGMSTKSFTGATTMSWTFGGGAAFWIEQAVALSPTAAGPPDTTPPSIPATPTLSNITATGMRITWGASTDDTAVTGYDLRRCAGTGCTGFIAVTTVTTTNFDDTGLTPGTSYTYDVRARDAAGNVSTRSTSSASNTLTVTSRTLTWTANAPLTQDGFAIFRCVTTAASCIPDSTVIYATSLASPYVDANSANPTTCYQVQATLAGTAGSALSNIGCGTGGAIRLTIATAGTGNGVTIPPVGTTSFSNGTVVGLTATPDDPGTFFNGWSGDADCSDGSVTLNSSTACTATWGRQSLNLAYLGTRGFRATRSLTNIISVTPTASVSKNNLLVLRVVTDNISTTSGQTGDHLKATDSQGNQYVKLGEQTRSTGSAGSGVTVSLWASRPFSTITTANTVNVTLSTATIANAVTLQEYLFSASTTFTNSTTTGTNGASASPSAVISGLTGTPHLYIAALGVEQPQTSTFTQSNDYSSFTTTNGTIGSASNANVQSIYGTLYHPSATGSTYAPALAIGTSPNWAMVFSAIATVPSVNTHPLTLATQGTGNGTVTGGGTFYEGSVVQIQAFPDSSSQFAGWFTTLGSTCTSPTNPTVNVTVNLDTICTASFTTPNVVLPNRVLTIVTAGTGTGTTTGAGTYPNGTVVNMTATPGASSFFAGWTPAACSSGSVTLTADTTCTATFTLLANATLTITNAGTGLGVTTGAGTYVQGSNAVLTATPNVGSIFTGWSGSTGCTGTTSPLTLLMDSTKACVANFTVFTGTGPTGFLVQQSNKRCPVSYQLALTSTLTIANVTWRVDGVNTMSQNPGGVMTQTVAPFIFTKTLVKDGAVITANVTDVAGAAAVIGPNVVACP